MENLKKNGPYKMSSHIFKIRLLVEIQSTLHLMEFKVWVSWHACSNGTNWLDKFLTNATFESKEIINLRYWY